MILAIFYCRMFGRMSLELFVVTSVLHHHLPGRLDPCMEVHTYLIIIKWIP